MAVHIDGIFDKSTKELITNSKVLVVGAGGIGCELLKNLVLTGFENIHVIDLDTIDLSNLNRQFLFHKQHIGRPKAVVAKESVLKFNPNAKITADHDSITNTKYNVEFFRQFSAVTNALDNIGARSHVNRMCLAADVPLIESGSAGYQGQTTVYRKGKTECFECTPKRAPKTYPGCTIRNTPSEPVHCVVWAKHLFNQLFGETDADEEVSPDVADPELSEQSLEANDKGNVARVSTRDWAKSTDYDPEKLFNKLFSDDIQYLNTMVDLWKTRPRPQPLSWKNLPDAVPSNSKQPEVLMKDHAILSLKQYGDMFDASVRHLWKRAKESDQVLIWDKDDDVCMDFVAACANLRSFCFSISLKSRFDIKAIAGNIIPAIASTNAVVAGLIVVQLLKVLQGDLNKCRTCYVTENYCSKQKFISSCEICKPNPKCYVCTSKGTEVFVMLNSHTATIKTVEEKILKEKLHMAQPDAVINDGSGKILISSDPDDIDEDVRGRTLLEFGIASETRLMCEDFLQHYKIVLVLVPSKDFAGQDFWITSNIDELGPEDEIPFKKRKEIDEVSLDVANNDLPPRKSKSSELENGTEEPPLKKLKA
ncbi:SUMO-activating enzyme subunit 2-like [Uloborus diversus]|uniref:SUMO-activating enzyme subunit 2-like n=1 Tax=Uloborus diversus TaxID=327109 RepID=UPI002409ED86|nr:SUMO-activating enzyme subunit 2-like [Uloborus diversus]